MGWLDRRGWLNRRGWSDGKCACIQFGCGNAKFAVDWIRGVDQGGGKSRIYPLLFILSVGQSEVRGWSDWRGHKVVLSKKKLTWSPPASHFIHSFKIYISIFTSARTLRSHFLYVCMSVCMYVTLIKSLEDEKVNFKIKLIRRKKIELFSRPLGR